MGERNRKHGLGGTKAYKVWHAMWDRCTNPTLKHFPNYGGRGITVCPEWLFVENFVEDMGHPQPGDTLERIDNSRGYSPSNCKWASQTENQRNKRSSTVGKVNGLYAREWAEKLGVNRVTIYKRLKKGYPPTGREK